MRPSLSLVALAASALLWTPHRAPAQAVPRDANAARDSADALATFRENLDAIHKRSKPRYLATYVHSPQLARHGLRGLETGYDGWSAITDNSWPDTLMVREMRVTPVAPGVVYGFYRYVGVNKGVASTGVSTRLFVRTPAGMRITVTASWPDTLPVPR
ncbi:MAG: hypothetical protein MUE41_06925 [Gemmatimonadaceae bacterium]|jgi:hypothetical protein|nr:hypothetical protein [Gemmatimonadaceae bacterium]